MRSCGIITSSENKRGSPLSGLPKSSKELELRSIQYRIESFAACRITIMDGKIPGSVCFLSEASDNFVQRMVAWQGSYGDLGMWPASHE